jgi:hypothetical protein
VQRAAAAGRAHARRAAYSLPRPSACRWPRVRRHFHAHRLALIRLCADAARFRAPVVSRSVTPADALALPPNFSPARRASRPCRACPHPLSARHLRPRPITSTDARVRVPAHPWSARGDRRCWQPRRSRAATTMRTRRAVQNRSASARWSTRWRVRRPYVCAHARVRPRVYGCPRPPQACRQLNYQRPFARHVGERGAELVPRACARAPQARSVFRPPARLRPVLVILASIYRVCYKFSRVRDSIGLK